jgi:multidrug resistance efflux pump
MKAKQQLATAEGNAANCKRQVEDIEKRLVEAMARIDHEQKAKAARDKAEADAKRLADLFKKVGDLEREVWTLKGKLANESKKQPVAKPVKQR